MFRFSRKETKDKWTRGKLCIYDSKGRCYDEEQVAAILDAIERIPHSKRAESRDVEARPDGGEPYGWIEPATGNFVDHATKVAMPADAASFTLAVYTHPAPAPDVARLVEASDKLAPWMSAALGDYSVCVAMKRDAEEFLEALEFFQQEDTNGQE